MRTSPWRDWFPPTVLILIGSCFALSLAQRGIFIAGRPLTNNVSELVRFDLAIWGLWLVLSPIGVAAARRWDFTRNKARHAAIHLVVATALAVAHSLALDALVVRGTYGVGAFERTTLLLSWRLPIDFLLYLGIVGAIVLRAAQDRANARDRDALRATADAAQARLAALELQLQPHFLFNTLNTAAMLARTGRAEDSADVITRLGNLLREVVAEGPGATVTLRTELDLVERYLAIERTRFGSRLTASINATASAMEIAVPRLLLQPLVENAVRHGIAAGPDIGLVTLDAAVEREELVITIADNGPGLSKGVVDEGLGIRNTRARLAALFGERGGLTLGAAATGGAVVTVRMPAS